MSPFARAATRLSLPILLAALLGGCGYLDDTIDLSDDEFAAMLYGERVGEGIEGFGLSGIGTSSHARMKGCGGSVGYSFPAMNIYGTHGYGHVVADGPSVPGQAGASIAGQPVARAGHEAGPESGGVVQPDETPTAGVASSWAEFFVAQDVSRQHVLTEAFSP